MCARRGRRQGRRRGKGRVCARRWRWRGRDKWCARGGSGGAVVRTRACSSARDGARAAAPSGRRTHRRQQRVGVGPAVLLAVVVVEEHVEEVEARGVRGMHLGRDRADERVVLAENRRALGVEREEVGDGRAARREALEVRVAAGRAAVRPAREVPRADERRRGRRGRRGRCGRRGGGGEGGGGGGRGGRRRGAQQQEQQQRRRRAQGRHRGRMVARKGRRRQTGRAVDCRAAAPVRFLDESEPTRTCAPRPFPLPDEPSKEAREEDSLLRLFLIR